MLPPVAKAHVRHRVARSVSAPEAQALAAELVRRLRFNGRRMRVVEAGSLARLPASVSPRTRVKDVDLLVIGPPGALDSVTLAPCRAAGSAKIIDAFAGGARKLGLIVEWTPARRPVAAQVDIFLAHPAEEPFALFHWRSPKSYAIRVRAYAKRKGWLLNQYGLFSRRTGRPVPGSESIRSEADLARFLGVTVRPPRARR
jgi:DNA polymerase/3'-5' exonuclease PolX